MKNKYTILVIAVLAIFMLRICLSNDKKKENDILKVPDAVVPVKVTVDKTVANVVNRGIFGINMGFAFKRELDKDSGFVQLLRGMHPASLRFPGGTVANYYHPHLPVYGYKVGEFPPGLGTLYMEQLNRKENILYNYIRLCKLVGARAVFCANVYNGTPEETLFVIDELKKNNVPILGVELGNEFCLSEYRKQFPDANVYLKKIKTTVDAIHAKYPDIKLVVIGGDGVSPKDVGGRGKFMRGWNTMLSKETFYKAYTWHPYENCPACDQEPYFDNLFVKNINTLAPQRSKYLLSLGLNLATIYGPDRKLWLTEWNIGNMSYLDNTFMQAAYVSEYFLTLIDLNVQYNNYFEVTNLHAMDGLINQQKGKQPSLLTIGTDNATTQYFAFQFLSSTISGDVFKAREIVTCSDTSVSKNFVCRAFVNKKENKVYLHFVNHSGKNVRLTVGDKNMQMEIRSVDASYPYAAAGKTQYEKDYPNKLKPVKLRSETVNGNAVKLAPYTFGYISYSL
ncbi:MAG: hypothetical protein JWN78_3034 [Bacteroidota bacterium]|nr:hypothetical protein [Bacteroidota bacterium]